MLNTAPGAVVTGYLSLTQDDDARNALQIRANFEQLPDVRVDKLLHRCALIEADLHDEVAVLFEKCGRFADQAPDDAESVRARREREERLLIAHFGVPC